MLDRIRCITTLIVLGTSASLMLRGCTSPSQRACGTPQAPRDNLTRQVTVLRDDLSPIRNAFNAASDRWRAVALVSPTCSECIYGAEAVQKEITSCYPAEQAHSLIVWIPMLPSDNEVAARSSAAMFPTSQNDRVTQFYDGRQTLGWRYAHQTFAGFYERARKSLSDDHWLATGLDDRIEQQRPQWDLYMLYAPGIRWDKSNDAPPMPSHWIRHLGRRGDVENTISTYWQDTPESGPREGDLFEAIRMMAGRAIRQPPAVEATIMRIEVLGFQGCSNTPQTRRNLDRAVASLGLAANVVYVDQQRLPETDRRRGWPSPTVLVDGRDLFGMEEPLNPATGCRMYTDGAPSEGEITDALRFISRS